MSEAELCSYVTCGHCEDGEYGVPVAENECGDLSITLDGLLQLREQGWEWDGIAWRCPACAAEDGDEPV
jgi:hypothetical protein